MKSIKPNFHKRSYTLPPGCKDLVDLLKPASKTGHKQTVGSESLMMRVNSRITAPMVTVIQMSPDKKSLGVLPLAEALGLAKSRSLDLIEVEPNSIPPVCLLMDFGLYRYSQK